jgi:hypothetical protein
MANLWDYLSNIPDVAKSFGTGLVNAGTQLVGTPGDLRSGVDSASNALFDRIDAATGYHPQQVQPRVNLLPTSDQLNSSLDFIRHQPETQGGQYAQTLGENLPPFFMGLSLLGRGPMAKEGMKYAMNAADEYALTPHDDLARMLLPLFGTAAAVPAAAGAHQNMNTDVAPYWLKALLTNPVGGGVSSAY